MPVCPHCQSTIDRANKARFRTSVFHAANMFSCPEGDKVLGVAQWGG